MTVVNWMNPRTDEHGEPLNDVERLMAMGNAILDALAVLGVRPEQDGARCYDCGRPYGDEHGFPDLLVPNHVWRQISPTGNMGGLLCPCCIVKRCVDQEIECLSYWASGPFACLSQPQWLSQYSVDPAGGSVPVVMLRCPHGCTREASADDVDTHRRLPCMAHGKPMKEV